MQPGCSNLRVPVGSLHVGGLGKQKLGACPWFTKTRCLSLVYLAYNLVRSLMWEAGERYGVDPLRLSLKGVVQQILAHRQYVGVFAPRTVVMLILALIQSNRISDRPDRCEPRVRKRRPKQYDLMNEPRHVLRRRLLCEA